MAMARKAVVQLAVAVEVEEAAAFAPSWLAPVFFCHLDVPLGMHQRRKSHVRVSKDL